MAKVLGFGEDEISKIPMDQIMYFFTEVQGEITSSELNALREEFMETRRKKAEGGKEGARRKKEKHLGNAEGNPKAIAKGSSSHIKSNQFNSIQLIGKDVMTPDQKAWVADYEASEDAVSQYLKASKG